MTRVKIVVLVVVLAITAFIIANAIYAFTAPVEQLAPEVRQSRERTEASWNKTVELAESEPERWAESWQKVFSKDEDDNANPYCDLVSDEYMQNGGVCHDRKDASDITGLFTCNDGTHKTDWRDCKDVTEDEEARELWWTTDKVEPCIVKPKATNLTIVDFRELLSPCKRISELLSCVARS